MAHTTRAIAKMFEEALDQLAGSTSPEEMDRAYERFLVRMFTPDQVTEPEPDETPSVITVEVRGGCVIDVRGLPERCDYEIIDHDDPEPEPEALYLTTVNILARSTSPGHAADAIEHILSDYDMANGTLIDWDYAVQDGERQYPRCVSLDLEPGNITELLDHLP